MIVNLEPDSPIPPYKQLRDQVVAGIRDGSIPAGRRLPTVRGLAEELGLAVNTVAKAYKQLEAEGHVQTRGRHGTVALPCRRSPEEAVAESAGRGDATGAGPVAEPAADQVAAAAVSLARAAQRRGLDLSETIGLLRQVW